MIINFHNFRGHTLFLSGLQLSTIIIDGGAHKGQFTNEVKNYLIGSDVFYVLVEANKDLFNRHLSGFTGNVYAYNAAILDKDNEYVSFNIKENLESSSICNSEDLQSNLVETITLNK